MGFGNKENYWIYLKVDEMALDLPQMVYESFGQAFDFNWGLGAIILLLVIAVWCWKLRVPMSATLFIGFIAMFGFTLVMAGEWVFYALFLFGILAAAVFFMVLLFKLGSMIKT